MNAKDVASIEPATLAVVAPDTVEEREGWPMPRSRWGMARVFLQVEAGNTAAQALYRRAGFETAWSYVYWRHA